MSDKQIIICLCVFLFIGFIFGVNFGILNSQEALDECQKDLPRDQYCTIIAVPENDLEETDDEN